VTQSTNHKSQDEWVIEWGSLPGAPQSTWDRYQWFYNPTKPTSMRLSKIGATWLAKKTTFVLHSTKLSKQITPKQLLQLERLLTAPYYINNLLEIWVHSETDAVMLILNSGNLSLYLDSLQE
jgi:hypothetical protein